MSHIKPILIFLLSLLPFIGFAADPTEQFAKNLLAGVDAEYWRGIARDKPPGGYLLRFEHDITGDGRKELFLASSLETDEGACAWSIYSPDAQQNYTKIGSNVVIPLGDGFYFKSAGAQRELQAVYKNQKFGLGIIDRYSVSSAGIVTHTKQELTAEQITQLDADNWKETFGIGEEVKPTVSKVLLAEYANNRSVQWRAYRTDLGVTDQSSDPADANAIAANSSFTLQIAKQLLGVQ